MKQSDAKRPLRDVLVENAKQQESPTAGRELKQAYLRFRHGGIVRKGDGCIQKGHTKGRVR